MKQNKGFTLIELLGVIVILAIIALIATPIILGVIEKVRLNAFINTNYGVIDAIEKECSIGTLTGTKCKDAYTFSEKNNDLKVKGQAPSKGIIFNENNKDTMMYTESSDGYCARKDLNGKIVAGKLIDNKCVIKDTYDYHHNDTSVGFSGLGTEDDPYQISSIEDLVQFSKECNGSSCPYASNYFVLTTSLDFQNDDSYINSTRTDFGDINGNEIVEDLKTELTTENGFKPISIGKIETFNFDGRNHAIKNLYTQKGGLFSDLTGKTIDDTNIHIIFRNLELIDSEITDTSYNTGTLIGSASNGIYDITNIIVSSNVSGQNNVGLLIGYISSNFPINVSDVYTDGNMKCTYGCGTIFGYSSGSLNFSNIINITDMNFGNYSGGIVGNISNNTNNENYFSNISNYGNINVNGQYVGGIIGYNSTGISNFKNIYNFGNIEGSFYLAGGLFGSLYEKSTIVDSINYGDIISNNTNCRIGGIAGKLEVADINNVKNYGNITFDGTDIGGLIGNMYSGKVVNSANYGNIIGKSKMDGLIYFYTTGLSIETENLTNYGTITEK